MIAIVESGCLYGVCSVDTYTWKLNLISGIRRSRCTCTSNRRYLFTKCASICCASYKMMKKNSVYEWILHTCYKLISYEVIPIVPP